MKVEFVPVWKQVTPDLAQELMAFWQASKAVVEPGAAATRALQAVCVARDGNGALCGVDDRSRCWKIGLADFHVDDVSPLGFQRLGAGEQLHDMERGDLSQA